MFQEWIYYVVNHIDRYSCSWGKAWLWYCYNEFLLRGCNKNDLLKNNDNEYPIVK